MAERPYAFSCQGMTIRGILHEPDGGGRGADVILFHGWGGYRVGQNGLLVQAARRFCREGFRVLRFDFRGRGESDGRVEEHDLNSMIEDAKAALEHVRQKLGAKRVFAGGICSGGEVAVGTLYDGEQWDGVMLWSAPVFSAEATAARKLRKSLSYLGAYVRKLFLRETWAKLFAGRIRFDIIRRVLLGGSVHEKKEGERAEMSRSDVLPGRCPHVLLIYGTADPIANEAIDAYTELFTRSGAKVKLHRVQGANHGFYGYRWQQEVIAESARWLVERTAEQGQ